MQRNAIFRIASMSKPVAAVAIMLLVDEGKVRLDDAVSRFLPDFAGAEVAMPKTPAGPVAAGSGAPSEFYTAYLRAARHAGCAFLAVERRAA